MNIKYMMDNNINNINFGEFPFGVPNNVKNSEKINNILKKSFNIQSMAHMSNEYLIVNFVIIRCLNAIGVNSKLVYGDDYVWLIIEDNIVDNTYIEDIPILTFIKMKQIKKYTPKPQEQFEWMIKNNNKILAISLNNPQIDKYFSLMIIYVYSTYNVQVFYISENAFNNCWECDKNDSSLKICSICKVAKYCDKECQKKDIKKHKMICMPK